MDNPNIATRQQPRRVLVTGAGSGIGLAIAQRFVAAGDSVIATVRDPERARNLDEERLTYLPLELASRDSVRWFAREIASLGDVDVVVHCAGYGVFGAIEDTDADATAHQMNTNILGPLELTRLLLPGLRKRHGRIIWIGSLAGRIALPFQAAYSASKAAMAAFSDALRLELRPFGVEVSLVEPGDFNTGFAAARTRRRAEASPYGAAFDACLAAVEQHEKAGPNPGIIAEKVFELAGSRHPPARIPLGPHARLLALLAGTAPAALREYLVKNYCRFFSVHGEANGSSNHPSPSR